MMRSWGIRMNSISPDPFHPNHLGHYHGHHHMMEGHHHGMHHHNLHKTFPDYTDRINQLPTPFFGEHNVPFDSVNVDANINNIGDRGMYIQTFNGNTVGSP